MLTSKNGEHVLMLLILRQETGHERYHSNTNHNLPGLPIVDGHNILGLLRIRA